MSMSSVSVSATLAPSGKAVQRLGELLRDCTKELAQIGEEHALMRQQLGYAEELSTDAVPQERGIVTGASDAAVPVHLKSSLKDEEEQRPTATEQDEGEEPANEGPRIFGLAPRWDTSSVSGSSYNLVSATLDFNKRPETKRNRRVSLVIRKAEFLHKVWMIFPPIPMSPNSNHKLLWDLFGLLLICWDMFFLPLQAFELEDTGFIVFMNWLTLVFWTLDMFMSNACGFYSNGELIMRMPAIWINYCKTWLFIDLLIVVPDWTDKIALMIDDSSKSDVSGAENLRLMRVFRTLRILRLLRLLKLERLVNVVYDFIDSEYSFIMVTMLRLVVFIIVLNHGIACLWYWVGSETLKGGFEDSWLNDTPNGDMTERDVIFKYTTALHWSLTQFTPASMEVSARNVPERLMSIVVLFFSLMMFSSVVGSITASMTALRSMQGDSKKQFWMLRRYFTAKRVPQTIRFRIIKYLEFQVQHKQNGVDKDSIGILNLLSGPLVALLAYELNKRSIDAHPFFAYFKQGQLKTIMIRLCHSVLKFKNFANEDVVFRLGEEATCMYFVQSGRLDYIHSSGLADDDHMSSMRSTMNSSVRADSENQDLDEPKFGYDMDHEPSLSGKPVLQRKSWLAEPALWTTWWHRGNLQCEDACVLCTIEPQLFVEIVRGHSIPWNFCRQYAISFVHHLNRIPACDLSDHWADSDFLQATVTKARQTTLNATDDGRRHTGFNVGNQDALDDEDNTSNQGHADRATARSGLYPTSHDDAGRNGEDF